jgi:quinol monooxygenase YgiN
MIAVIAKIPIKPGKFDEAVALFKGTMVHIAREEGTLLYTLNRDPSKPDTLVIIERYRDKAALDTHSKTPHFKEFSAKLPEFLAGKPEIVLMEEINAVQK